VFSFVSSRFRLAALMFTLFAAGLVVSPTLRADSNPQRLDSGVGNFTISPDSKYAVYVRLPQGPGSHVLYSKPLAGGNAVALNESIAIPQGPDGVQITSNSAHVVYLNEQQGFPGKHVYTVPITGGDIRRLSNNSPEGQIRDFLLMPDGERVVYVVQSYVSSISNGSAPPIRLNAQLASDEQIKDFKVTADGSRLIYRVTTGQWDSERSRLDSVSVSGGTPITLDGPFSSPNGIKYYLGPDNHLIYHRWQPASSSSVLYRVPVGGGTPVKLPLPDDLRFQQYVLSPDGKRILLYTPGTTPSESNLYVLSINGEPLVRLTPDSVTVNGFEISPDSNTVVFTASTSSSTIDQLYSIPITGGSTTKLNGKLDTTSGLMPSGVQGTFFISPNSTHVVYLADQLESDGDERLQLYSVPIKGSTAATRIGNFESRYSYSSGEEIEFAANGSLLLYRIPRQTADGTFDLFVAPVSTSEHLKLNDGVGVLGEPAGDTVNIRDAFTVSSDSRFVLFRGTEPGAEPSGLYLANLPETEDPMTNVYLPLIVK
jgi:Tol biopolymer transport system component